MGTQQLLLIGLGIMVVGIAIALANTIFDSNAESSLQDQVAMESYHLATLATQYFHKPSEFGGGGKKFSGWKINANLDTTNSGIYSIKNMTDDKLVLEGKPFENLNYKWTMITTVTGQDINTSVKYTED
ncbi:MAG: hypothetical protein P8Y79_02650 [Ignavibacteriaceae bacterium]